MPSSAANMAPSPKDVSLSFRLSPGTPSLRNRATIRQRKKRHHDSATNVESPTPILKTINSQVEW
jgi:hypothetical protein